MLTYSTTYIFSNAFSLLQTAAKALPDQGTLTTALNTTVEPGAVFILSVIWVVVVFLIARHIGNKNIRDGIELPRSKQKQIHQRYLRGRW
jgi:hypothetical protein